MMKFIKKIVKRCGEKLSMPFMMLLSVKATNAKKAITKYIKRNSELLTIPLAIGVWHLFKMYAESGKLAIYDEGIFQKLIFAFIAVLVIKAATWFMLSIDQPYLRKYLDAQNEKKWYSFSDQQKMFYATIYFVLYAAQLTLIVTLV